MTENTPLITVDNLVMHFPIYRGVGPPASWRVHAVDGISFQ